VRVAFELTVLELDASGTARAVRGLRDALAARDDVELVPLRHPRRPFGPRGQYARGLDRELRWFPFALPAAARSRHVDLLHCPAALGPLRGRVPLVITVNDVLPLEHPAWFARANVLQQRLALGRLVRRAHAVLVPSHHTAHRLAARTGVASRRVHIGPYGVGAPFGPGAADGAVLAAYGLYGPYVLTVATLQPRKNLEAVLAAHTRLARRGVHVPLVVVGGRGWHDDALIARLGGASDVVVTGRVSDAELVALLRGATCLLYPSRHEGFGFPPLEAMACGTPVIAARASSVPEVVGEAGELVDVDDPDAVAVAVERLLGDGALRARLREAGLARAAGFTWERCAELTVAAYRTAVDRR
jgi:glycosyltransferase involved in cell wall biosynthesis